MVRGVQGPGEIMLIPSGWWHMAYNPEETFAFSSQFLNPQACPPPRARHTHTQPSLEARAFDSSMCVQNYRPALIAVITGNPVVAACAQQKGLVVPAADGRKDWCAGYLPPPRAPAAPSLTRWALAATAGAASALTGTGSSLT